MLWSEFGQTPWRRVWIRPEIRSFPKCRSPETSVRSRARSTALTGRGGRKFASEVGCLTGTRCKDAIKMGLLRQDCYQTNQQQLTQWNAVGEMSFTYLEFLDLKVVGYQHHFLNCTRTQVDSEIANTLQRKNQSAYLSWKNILTCQNRWRWGFLRLVPSLYLAYHRLSRE